MPHSTVLYEVVLLIIGGWLEYRGGFRDFHRRRLPGRKLLFCCFRFFFRFFFRSQAIRGPRPIFCVVIFLSFVISVFFFFCVFLLSCFLES